MVANQLCGCFMRKEMHMALLLNLKDTHGTLVSNADCKQNYCLYTGKLHRAPFWAMNRKKDKFGFVSQFNFPVNSRERKMWKQLKTQLWKNMNVLPFVCVLLSAVRWGAIIGLCSSVRIWCVHQGPRGERSGSGEPSALSGQVTLNDPEIGRPRLPEEEHSITPVCVCVCYNTTISTFTTLIHKSVNTYISKGWIIASLL